MARCVHAHGKSAREGEARLRQGESKVACRLATGGSRSTRADDRELWRLESGERAQYKKYRRWFRDLCLQWRVGQVRTKEEMHTARFDPTQVLCVFLVVGCCLLGAGGLWLFFGLLRAV